MKQVKFLNESDRPKEEKPLEFTVWYKNTKGVLDNHYVNKWDNSVLNKVVSEYAAYLASFPTEKKKVEFRYCLQKGMIEFWELRDVDVDTTLYSDFTVIGKHRVVDITYTVFVGVRKSGEEHYFLGHLNSGYY